MNTLIAKINFSALSQGEQANIYRIIKKAQMCQPVNNKEQKFIEDMASRSEKSKPDQLDKAWANLVAYVGVNAGSYIAAVFGKTDKAPIFPNTEALYTLPRAELVQMIKRVGGSLDKIEMIVDSRAWKVVWTSPIPHDRVVDFSVHGSEIPPYKLYEYRRKKHNTY